MPLFSFKLPDIGEGVMEGEIVAWLVEKGQAVSEDQPMVEVMTDKATVTIGAPKAGVVTALEAGVGDTVPVGSVIVVIDTANGAPAAPASAAPASAAPAPVAPVPVDEGPAATAVGDIRESLPGADAFAASPAPAAASGGYYADKPLATPATRKLARDLDVDLRRVEPTGPRGRVTKGDVARHAREAAAPTAVGAPAVARPAAAPSVPAEDAALEERVPFVGVRRRIAERMQRATNTAAHFTFVEECDVGRLRALRARLKPAAEEQGVKLTYLPFIVKAVVRALEKHPILNSALDESTNELVTRRYHHIGIATSTDLGLMVPVVRDAGRKSLLAIAREIEALAEAARGGRIAPADLTGSTFTITSLGAQGGYFATPILNVPEVGILGVHRIKERPVVRGGEIVIGHVMLLSLSFDHRIVDGHVGAAFAYDVLAYLEDPDRLFLEMA